MGAIFLEIFLKSIAATIQEALLPAGFGGVYDGNGGRGGFGNRFIRRGY